MPTTSTTAAAKTITYKNLASFAPPAVVAAAAELAGETKKKSFTVADVQALAAHFADSEDFDSKSYLDNVLAGLSSGASAAPAQAPRDPITAEAETAAAQGAKVTAATKAIAKATGMPAEHAELYADAGFTVDEATRGWKAGLKGGQAFMFIKLGTTADQAIALGKAKVDGRAAYALLEARIPAELVPAFIERGLTGDDAEKFAQRGVFPNEMLEFHDLGIKSDKVPATLTLDQVKKVTEHGIEFSKAEDLVGGGMTLDDALALLATPAADKTFLAKRIFQTGKVTVAEMVGLYSDKSIADLLKRTDKLLDAGFTAASIHTMAAHADEIDDDIVINNAVRSGYSCDEIAELWQEGLGLKKKNPTASGLESYHDAGFTVAQLREVGPAGVESYSLTGFRSQKLSPAEIIELARAGYGSYPKFKEEFLDVGIKAKDALELIRTGE